MFLLGLWEQMNSFSFFQYCHANVANFVHYGKTRKILR